MLCYPQLRNWLALFGLLVLCMGRMQAQVQGRVEDAFSHEPLAGAMVTVQGSQQGALTDSAGRFVFPEISKSKIVLTFSMIGFDSQTQVWESGQSRTVALVPHETMGVTITDRGAGALCTQPIKTQLVTLDFMRGLPGNNSLMETIDYVNGLRQQINCGVCGTNDIHINGMEGPYTLVLIDGMPIVSSLGSVYGLNGIPQSMIERIEIVKGPAATRFGSEAMGGVVNVVTRDPRHVPAVSAGLNFNSHAELGAELGVKARVGKLQGLLSGNYYHMQNRLDRNGDNFTDVPLSMRGSAFTKWVLARRDGRTAQVAFKYYDEDRFGGQLQWQPRDRGSDTVYGESIHTRRLEALATYQLPLANENIHIDLSFARHFQDSYYGTTAFQATQFTGYGAAIWTKERGKHALESGAMVRLNDYDDNTAATAITRDRTVLPGAFVQDVWRVSPRLRLLGGLRADHHPAHGLIASPRLNLHWQPRTYTNVRLTAGRGFRTVNLFTEEHAALTGARTVVVAHALAPERSLNLNLNFTQVLNLGNSAATLDMDAFFTHFDNRILPDYSVDPSLIVYDNLAGHARIMGISGKWSHSFKFPLTLDLGGTWMRSTVYEDGLAPTQQLLTPVFQGVFNVGYKFPRLRSTVRYLGKVVGPMELPQYAAPFERPTRSGWFTEQNIQVSTDLGRGLSMQLGCRNLLNYTQPSPLVNPSQPFSDTFDTAYAYGPLQTRRVVVGFLWNLEPRAAASKAATR